MIIYRVVTIFKYVTTYLCVDENDLYLVEWYTCDNDKNDFYFAYKTTKETIKNYIECKISHLEMIKTGKDYYLFENDFPENFNNIKSITFDELDQKSLPHPYAYFDVEQFIDEEDLLILKQIIK